jgi:hypothetical protein
MGIIYRTSGRVVDIATGRGIAGLRVEAWDKDLIFNDLLGSAVTDGKGRFQIGYQDSDFKDLFGDKNADLFFRVFHEGVLIKSTEDSVLWNVEDEKTEIQIDVDLSVGKSP